MNASRFREITAHYSRLRIAVVGDFFLDRYLLIDPSLSELSIETGLPVHNVVSVRAQAGAAGTIVNNLVALGVGEVFAVGFCGDDGEGYELRRALSTMNGVNTDHFLSTPDRRTPVYCKPLISEPGKPPVELNRFDSKNRDSTPTDLQRDLASRLLDLSGRVDAILLMDQVEIADSGVVTRVVLDAASEALRNRGDLLVLADSRRGLADYPPFTFKMNAAELGRMTGEQLDDGLESVSRLAGRLSDRKHQAVFVTLAERGIVCASPGLSPNLVPAHPVRGPIDIVGAGDSVTSNLAVSLASGSSAIEAMELAMAAASIVVHKLGTTGTATVAELKSILGF